MIEKVGEIFIEIVTDLEKFKSQLAEASQEAGNISQSISTKMQDIGKATSHVGEQLTKNISLPLAAIGAGASKLAMDFEKSMQMIVGLVGASQEQVRQWGEEIKRMAPELGKSPRELADALYFIVSAGVETSKALDVLRASAQAASAGLGETKVIADAVTSAVNAYAQSGLTASQATSILVAAVREGKAEASELAPVLGRILPIAANLGIGLDEVAASLAAMTRIGLDAAEAATALRGIMTALLKPSKQAEEALSQVGLSTEILRKKIREEGLFAALQSLNTAMTALGEEGMARVFGNVRGLVGALALVGENSEQVRAIFTSLSKTTEEDLNKAFESAAMTMSFKMNQTTAQLQATLIELGTTLNVVLIPVLNTVNDILKIVANWFSNLTDEQKKTIVQIGLFVVALGPVLSILGSIISTIGTLSTVLSALCVGPAAPFILVATAVAALFLAFQTNFLGIRSLIEGFFATVVDVFNGVTNIISSFAITIPSVVENAWNAIVTGFKEALEELFQIVTGIFNNVTTAVTALFEAFKTNFLGIESLIEGVATAVTALFKTFQTNFLRIKSLVEGFYTTVVNVFDGVTNIISSFAKTIPSVAENAGKAIVTGFKKAIEELPKIVTGILERILAIIASYAQKFLQAAAATASKIWEGFKSALGMKSPSYLEVAMENILASSHEMLAGLKRDMGKLSHIAPNLRYNWRASGTTLEVAMANIRTPFLERLAGLKRDIGTTKQFSPQITIHSNAPLSPSQMRWEQEKLLRKLALEWGIR